MIAAARALGDVEFGKFTFALMLGGIFETLMDFGLHQVSVRAVARDKSSAAFLLQHMLAIKLLWAAGTLTLLIVTANLLDPHHDVRVACYLIGGSLVFRSYMLTIRGVLQGLEDFRWDLVVAVADRGLLLAFGLWALWSGYGLRGLTIAFVVARGAALALAAAVTHFRLGGLGVRYDRAVWYDLHKTALPLGFFLIVLNLYSYVDSVMLGSMRTFAETGLYGAAYKIYEGFTYGALALSAVLTPRLSALFMTNRAGHRRVALGGVAGVDGARHGGRIRRVHHRHAASRVPVRFELRGRDDALPSPVHRVAGRVCDLDPARDCDLGRSRTLAAHDRRDRPRCERRGQPVRDSPLRAERRRVCDGARRDREHGRSGLRPSRHAMRQTRRSLFVLLFASYAYFYQAGGWNQNSRFDLVRAITNEHTLNIDPFQHATGDKAFFDGHYYSDKAPGIALTAVPLVAFTRPILHALGGDPETLAGLALLSYLSTVFTAGLLTALAGVCLFTLSLELGASTAGALFAALTFGLATPIWTLATIFIGHAFAAALLVVRVCGGLAYRRGR